MKLHTRSLLLCLTGLSSLACGSGAGTADTTGRAAGEDFTLVLERTVNDVIVPTYSDLKNDSATLHACIQELAAQPSDEQLELCRKAWVAARVPWEQSEAFLFGPVSDMALDPAIDTWPVDHVQLEALLASDIELSVDTIHDNLGGGLKGFHPIEYLLWGDSHERAVTDLTSEPRQVEFLLALAEVLEDDTSALWSAWAGSDGEPGYGEGFAAAGTTSGVYYRQTDAIQELVNGMIAICDEVAYGKIAEPYKARDPALVESQFAYNSILDFSDNVRSVRNVYQATLDGTVSADSLSAVVLKYDPALDEQVRAEISAAISAIDAIDDDGQPFRDAVMDPSKDGVIEAAQNATATVLSTLSGEVLPLVAR